MVYKRITTRKTKTGYSVSVQIHNPDLVKPLVFGIERFFAVVDRQEHPERYEYEPTKLYEDIEKIKNAKVIKY